MLDITIGNFHYTQRNEFSKIMKVNIHTNEKELIDALEELPFDEYILINDALEITKNPLNYFSYEDLENNEIRLINFLNNGLKNIVIPEYIDGKKVVEIDEILNNEKIEKLYFPNSLKKITEYLCYNCYELKEVYLPKTLEKLEAFTFTNCYKLEKINLENIKSIGVECFAYCSKLKNLKLDSLHTISPFAFYNCTSIFSILAPNLRYISNSAFESCINLQSIFFNEKLTHIGNSAFKDCICLSKIKLTEFIFDIQANTFENCKSLTTINFPKELAYIREKAFADSGLSGILNLPENLAGIKKDSFKNCNFEKINISRKIPYGDNAFDAKQLLVLNIYDKIEEKENDIER